MSADCGLTSCREGRLWLATLVTLVALFSTVGLASRLAPLFEGSGIGVWLFILCCFMVLLAVITRGVTTRPALAEIAVGLGVLASYLLVFVRMSIPTERSHLIEYGVVAILIHEALTERARHRYVPRPALQALFITVVLGALDETLQLVVPGRVFDPQDILFNTLAATMAIAASVALEAASQTTTRGRVP